MEVEVEVEKGIWWGDAGDDGKGERGRDRGIRERARGKGLGDRLRAAMRVCGASVASTDQQTQAECAGGLTGGLLAGIWSWTTMVWSAWMPTSSPA